MTTDTNTTWGRCPVCYREMRWVSDTPMSYECDQDDHEALVTGVWAVSMGDEE
jgi:hypothetical protein